MDSALKVPPEGNLHACRRLCAALRIPVAALLSLLLLTGASPGLETLNYQVDRIELNNFGWDNPRTAVIFWDYDGQIYDWRWHNPKVPLRWMRDGCYEMSWMENNKLIRVRAEDWVWSRTIYDVELQERAKLPEHKRKRIK